MINKIKTNELRRNSGVMRNLFAFVAAHPINERVVYVKKVINWDKSVRKCKKRASSSGKSSMKILYLTI